MIDVGKYFRMKSKNSLFADVACGNSLTACSNNTRNSLLLAFVLSFGFLCAGCGANVKDKAEAQSQQPSAAANRATPVDVAIAKTGVLQKQPEFTATTAPFRTVSLRSQIEGQLLALSVDVGSTVKQGQVIGQVDDALLVTTLNQAEAELASLKSEVARTNTQIANRKAEVERLRLELVQAQSDAKRQQQLFKEGAIAEQAAQQSRTEAQTAAQALRAAISQVSTEQQAVATAQGRVVAQQAVVAEAKKRRSYARLVSPINGVVAEKVSEPGNLLQPGNEVIKISDLSKVKVVVQLSELELGRVRVGQQVQVRLDAFPNQTYTGVVGRISPVADATARLVPVEVDISNNNGKIGSGLLARVTFNASNAERVVIPLTALTESGQQNKARQSQDTQNSQPSQSTIFVLQLGAAKPTVSARSVTLGQRSNGNVEILSGLQPGESFVVRSGRPLKDGETVGLSILSEKS
ncbi:RND family efflux transporter MFP subunit [Calothrix sp. NIES-4071]|nr:RND family efflux transporter MFP subunit [Calothrix sp. NIES-4071]BAZ62437.1 RND family efflux transporter MFP subunit [Calothrix sp. NIES-4105]